MRRIYSLLVLCLLATHAQAHHATGHGMSGPSFNPITSVRSPRTIVGFGINADALDADQGYAVTYKLNGEYALTRRFSVGAVVPVSTVRTTGLQNTGLADLNLIAKGTLFKKGGFLLLGNGTLSLPTGPENSGLGSGDVLFSPALTVLKNLSRFGLFVNAGSTMAWASETRPSLDYAVGAIATLVTGEYPLEAVVSVQGNSIFASHTFQNGSTKLYLNPALVFPLGESSRLTVGGKFALADDLKLKPGVVLSTNSTALFTDVRASVLTTIDFFF